MQIIVDDQGCLDYYRFEHGVLVERLADESHLHEDDRESVPDGEVSVIVQVATLHPAAITEAALDDFHDSYGIKALDDFDISVKALDDRVMGDLAREAISAWCAQHELTPPPALLADDVNAGLLMVILARLERHQVSTRDLPDYLESVLTITNWASAL